MVKKEAQKGKFQKRIELSSSLIPKGKYQGGKLHEDDSRPKSIKENVSIEKEEESVKFELNPKYHPKKKKK